MGTVSSSEESFLSEQKKAVVQKPLVSVQNPVE